MHTSTLQVKRQVIYLLLKNKGEIYIGYFNVFGVVKQQLVSPHVKSYHLVDFILSLNWIIVLIQNVLSFNLFGKS